MLLEMKCVFEAVYDESDFYYTHSYIQLYTQAKFALKILSHNFQVQILNTSRVCVWEREKGTERDVWLIYGKFFFLVGKRQLPYLGEREVWLKYGIFFWFVEKRQNYLIEREVAFYI